MEIPVYLIILFYAAQILYFILFCLAMYYLFSRDYHYFLFVVSAIFFASMIFYVAFKYLNGDVVTATLYCSFPFSLFGTGSDLKIVKYLFFLFGLIINYLALFAIFNSIHKILKKVFIS